jgi:FkbH-like protein
MRRYRKENLDPAAAAFVVSQFAKIRDSLPMKRCRLHILRSFTVEPLVLLLRAFAAVHDIDCEISIGDFNTYTQEILDPSSALYQCSPDIVVLAVQTRDISSKLWSSFADLSGAEARAEAERVIRHFHDLINVFRSRSQASMIIHSLELPIPAHGILDSQLEPGQLETVQSINRELAGIAREQVGVYILDYDGLIARHGRDRWFDEHKWVAARLPVAAGCLNSLAAEWLRYVHVLCGKICKAVAVDLDNTLWGGVIGEDGFRGIKLNEEYPGIFYMRMQRALLDLHDRGILLAICSKNNSEDAMHVLEGHPHMQLRPEHFAAVCINWNDKAANLREIASRLNIGIDALAFVDDSPVERDWVRTQLPELTVIDLPNDPAGFAQAIKDAPALQRLALTTEDRNRSRYYAAQRTREELQSRAPSLGDFYRSLEMKAHIARVTTETLARVAQLTQKTNQFNLTTRRYTEPQIASLAIDPNWRIYSIRVWDRFADNGLVGVAMVRYIGSICEIDNFLLSCRVIGRTVERALLAGVAQEAKNHGLKSLIGRYLPTTKNAPAKEFYASVGFSLVGEQQGGYDWEFDLTKGCIEYPPWIAVECMPQ